MIKQGYKISNITPNQSLEANKTHEIKDQYHKILKWPKGT